MRAQPSSQAAKLQEGQMDVSPVLVADLQAPEAVEPGERPFDHPAVASQAVLGLDTTAGDAGDDAALAQGQTEVTVVVTLVGMELVRSATGPAARLGADGLDGVARRSVALPGAKAMGDNVSHITGINSVWYISIGS